MVEAKMIRESEWEGERESVYISKSYHLQRVFLKYFQLFFSIISKFHRVRETVGKCARNIWNYYNLRDVNFSVQYDVPICWLNTVKHSEYRCFFTTPLNPYKQSP